MSNRNIGRYIGVIDRSIHTIDPPLDYDRLQWAIVKLCDCINASETNENTWSLGESTYSGGLDNLLIGAFWHFTEWHGGQTSTSYLTLCAIGSIFDPNMTGLPDESSPEYSVYKALNDLAEEQTGEA